MTLPCIDRDAIRRERASERSCAGAMARQGRLIPKVRMNKQTILEEIKRIALDNGGQAPGMQAFARITGVKKSDWYPHIWLRWGDAVTEAGYAPNQFQTRTSDDALIEMSGSQENSEGFRLRARFGARQESKCPSHTMELSTGLVERINCWQRLRHIAVKLLDSKTSLRFAPHKKTRGYQWRSGVKLKSGPGSFIS
jgi:hypothetical protein